MQELASSGEKFASIIQFFKSQDESYRKLDNRIPRVCMFCNILCMKSLLGISLRSKLKKRDRRNRGKVMTS